MKPFSILHISDLHRSPSDPVSNDELTSALMSDRDRYIREDPPVAVPEAIVVSGDIIQGVPLDTDDSRRPVNFRRERGCFGLDIRPSPDADLVLFASGECELARKFEHGLGLDEYGAFVENEIA
jgi:hypothetical protein